MNIYDISKIEAEIEQIASQNEGEIPAEKMEALVLANTQAIEQVEKLVQYVRHLDMGIENVDSEIKRLQTLKDAAGRRIESIKAYLIPFVSNSENKKVTAGTFNLSIRTSEAVIIPDNFANRTYMTEKTTLTPDKRAIKDAISKGIDVGGAWIERRNNLQIK